MPAGGRACRGGRDAGGRQGLPGRQGAPAGGGACRGGTSPGRQWKKWRSPVKNIVTPASRAASTTS